MKITAFVSNGSLASLTEAEVMKIIQDNYASLDLRVYDNLHRYYEPIGEYVELSDKRMVRLMGWYPPNFQFVGVTVYAHTNIHLPCQRSCVRYCLKLVYY